MTPSDRSDQPDQPDQPAQPARRVLPAVLAALLLILTALVAAGPAQAAGRTGVPPGGAWVRTGHFVPGMGATTVELTPQGGGATTTTLAQQATYGDVSTYTKLAPGTWTAVVREDAAPASAAPVLSRTFEVTAGSARTVAVVGTPDQPRLALLTDDLTPPPAGSARVRVLSAAETAGTLTVKAVGGPTIAAGAVLGQAGGYTTVPAGSWRLKLSTDAGSGSLAERQPVAVTSGSVYTVVALDGASGVELRVVTDAAGAVTAPQGGAKTGGGGTAVDQAVDRAGASTSAPALGLLGPVGLLGLLGAALLLAVGARRRRVTR